MVIENLGDRGLLITRLPEDLRPWHAATSLRDGAIPDVVDVVSSFDSVGVLFGAPGDVVERESRVRSVIEASRPEAAIETRLWVVPVCYELGEDLEDAATELGISVDRAIELHTATEYVVQAIGFCPGFPYLGFLAPELSRLSRRPSPRPRVPPGSVAIAHDQTGIYPEACPGGWHLIGRTPCRIVDVDREWFPLAPGHRVRFRAVDRSEYARHEGEAIA